MKCPMRAFAITGMLTAFWMPAIISGSDIRATPPSRRMSAGTRSSAITAAAPASSATFACSGVTTSMITPPLSISARPLLTVNVASSRMKEDLIPVGACTDRPPRTCAGWDTATCGGGFLEMEELLPLQLLQAEGLDAVVVLRRVLRVNAVSQSLDQAQQSGMRAHIGRAVRGVVELDLR